MYIHYITRVNMWDISQVRQYMHTRHAVYTPHVAHRTSYTARRTPHVAHRTSHIALHASHNSTYVGNTYRTVYTLALNMSYVLTTTGIATIVDGNDSSKGFGINLLSATSGANTNFLFTQTATRNITIPNATTTMVGTDVTQTLTNKTIDASLNTLTGVIFTNTPNPAIGFGASAASINGIALGSGSTAATGTAMALGLNATSSAANSVAVGPSTTASGAASTAVGPSAVATAASAIAIGNGASATGAGSMVVGTASSDAGFANVEIIGKGITAMAANQLMIGSQAHNGQILTTGSITTTNTTPATLYTLTLTAGTGNIIDYDINSTLGISLATAAFTGKVKVNVDIAGGVTLNQFSKLYSIDSVLLTSDVSFVSPAAYQLSVVVTGIIATNIKWSGMMRISSQAY